RLAFATLGDGRDRAVAAAFADPFAVAFRRQQISLARHREAVGAVGLLANDTDLSVRIEAVDAIGTDIGEIKAAVRRADRPFREPEPRPGTGRARRPAPPRPRCRSAIAPKPARRAARPTPPRRRWRSFASRHFRDASLFACLPPDVR